ncbi:MAG: hypothetical protein ABJF04_22030 [Reichenbachiella sp.]|uniref:hypothetical protein n=5 Tax=Reichenbachiella sp. TaxID=2184521 RepID=UPI0032660341
MRNILFRTLAWSCLFIPTACHVEDLDKVKPVTISPHLALSLGFSEYTVLELLEDLDNESLVVNDQDQTIALYFEDSTDFSSNNELIAIGSVANQEEFAPAVNLPAAPFGYKIDVDQTFTFSFPANNGEEIDSLFFSSGTLDFEMESTFKGDIDYTWVIEGTQDVETEENLTQTKQLSYISGSVTDSYSRSLGGLKSKFYKNSADENEFAVKVTGTISFDSGTEVLPSHKMTFDLGFNNPGFSKLYGNFGSEPIALQSQTIAMPSLDDFSGDGLKLEDPSILLITKNSYGLDFELSFDEVKAIASDNSEIVLTEKASGIDGLVASPDIEGEVKVDTVMINNENSNIDELLNSAPTAMEFTISGVPNPVGTTRDPNFLLASSEIKVKSVIIIPMQFQMDGFSVDFEFDLDGLDIDEAESLTFNLISTNEIPFSGSIDLKFADANGNILYELLDAAAIESPTVGTDGKSTEAMISTSGISLTQEGIDALLIAEKVLAVANISTFESDKDRFITLYADYKLKVELSLAGEVTIEL